MIQLRGDVDHTSYLKVIDQIVKKLRIKSLVEDPAREITVVFSKANRKILGECDGVNKNKIKISIYTAMHKKDYKTKKQYNANLLNTLIHEFVHARQFMKGELASFPGYYKYKSKKYLPTQPWEDEAYEKAEKVAKKIK